MSDRLATILASLGNRWPVATGPGWAVVKGDCLDVMAAMPDKCVEHFVSDPPYDDRTHNAVRVNATGYVEVESSRRAAISRNLDLGFDALTRDQMVASAKHMARLVARWSLAFCSVEMVSDWRESLNSAGIEYLRACVWNRLNGTPQFTGDRPASAVEAIVCAHRRGRKRWNAGGKRGIYSHPIVLNRGAGEDRVHTTQKPIGLMVEILADFTDPGDLVLDAFAGSATTGIACLRLGRQFIGIERDPAYFEIACRRMRGDEAKPRPEQPSIFDLIPAATARAKETP